MRCRKGHYILCTSLSVGLRRGCGLSLSTRFGIQLTLVAGYRRVSSLVFDKHLVWSLSSVFEMVSSPAFNVSMFIWSLPVAVPFFISRSAASTSHDVITGTFWGQCGL